MTSATFRGGHPGLLGQDQGQVGGQVAVLGVFGRLHFEGGQGLKSEFARGPGPFGTGGDQVTDGFFDVHLYVNFLSDSSSGFRGAHLAVWLRADTQVRPYVGSEDNLLVPKLDLGTHLKPKPSLGTCKS